MKILHVVPSLGLQYGGVSTSVRDLCRGLAQLGLEITIWTTWRGYHPATDRPADSALTTSGVQIRYFDTHRWKILAERYAYSPALHRALCKELRFFDLVHIHSLWLHPTFAAAQACRRQCIPYLISPCGALDFSGLRQRRILKQLYMNIFERSTLAGAAAIHFTSVIEKERSFLFGTTPPCILLPRAMDLKQTRLPPQGTFRSQYPQLGQHPILLFLGRLYPAKRLDIVVEAFIRVSKVHADVRLAVVGPEEGAGAAAQRKLREAGLLDRAVFTGLLANQEKWAALRDSTLFLLPSEHENFGVAILEALAVRIPVLLSKKTGLSEAVEQAGAGVVLDQDPAQWARCISSLLEDPLLRERMGQRGRHLVETVYALQNVSQKMLEAYQSLLNRPPPSSRGALKALQAQGACGAYRIANGCLSLIRKILWPGERPLHPQRVCVLRVGNVGDIVCALPALHSIRQAYPRAHLTLLTSPGKRGIPGASDLLAEADWIDSLLVYFREDIDTFRKRIQWLMKLRKQPFDVWVELPNDLATVRMSLRNILLAFLAGARWAYGWRISTLRRSRQAQSEYLLFPNEVDRLMRVVKEAGFPCGDIVFPLPLRTKHREAVDRLLKKHGLHHSNLVAIAPVAKRSTNLWGKGRFATVGRSVVQRGFRVVVIGGAPDAALCQEVAQGIGEGGSDLSGQTSLLETCVLLKRCHLLICVDSGIQHLASAVGTPCLSLFSFWQLKGKWHPYGEMHTVMQKWVACHTCYLETCPYENHCMNLIEPEEVVSLVNNKLRAP